MSKKVLLGMSGGVDSSTSAILLKEAGYEVIGCTMKLISNEEENSCCSLDNVYDAKRVCDILGIPHYTFNFTSEFKKHVIDNFIETYKLGKTPNPCIECNKYLKFRAMYEKAKELGIDYIATGHYAKTEYSEKYNKYVLKKSKSIKKDQSYVLYNIPEEIIQYVIFPLGDFESKDEIREIAKKHNLNVASKPDSQEICFIPDDDYIGFLKKNDVKLRSGNILDNKGRFLAKHEGVEKYTVGQRKGLGISTNVPMYVIKLEGNDVVVGEEKEIYSKEVYVSDLNWLVYDNLYNETKVMAKIRYSSKEAEATIYHISENKVKVIFEESQRAITPGQAIVFYDTDGIILGGGKII